jgi:MazG family protein
LEDLEPLQRLRAIVGRLREPGGCPWDREQTPASLRPLLVEEAHEVLEAINLGDDANLCEELGDLLLHVVMQARMGEERGAFDLDEVAEGICAKMVRRHPHVFGSDELRDTNEVLRRWDEIKRAEKGGATGGALDHVPKSLPGLLRAQAVQKKAARVGFDWPGAGPVFAKLVEETDEIREAVGSGDQAAVEREVGDLLFTAVNLARKLGVDAETALAGTTNRFMGRFRAIEERLAAEGRSVEGTSLEELDRIWDEVKRE